MRFPFALALLFACDASAQSVISAHSGVVNLFEGLVLVDEQPLEQKFGTFPSIKEGFTLRTENGRAEVLLTPGVFLRVGENSAIRLISNLLTNTRVELLHGSAILDSTGASGAPAVAIVYKDREVRFSQAGLFGFDSETSQFNVFKGEATVSFGNRQLTAKTGQVLPLEASVVARKFADGIGDPLYDWSRERGDTIASDNLSAVQAADTSVLMTGGSIGYPMYFPATGLWSSPGLYSLYAPRYYTPASIYPLYPIYPRWPRTRIYSIPPRPVTGLSGSASAWQRTYRPSTPTFSHSPGAAMPHAGSAGAGHAGGRGR